jgi:hypothetical protein
MNIYFLLPLLKELKNRIAKGTISIVPINQ